MSSHRLLPNTLKTQYRSIRPATPKAGPGVHFYSIIYALTHSCYYILRYSYGLSSTFPFSAATLVSFIDVNNADPKNKKRKKRDFYEKIRTRQKTLNKKRRQNEKCSNKITVLVSYNVHDNV